ncbi:hypothetical protein DSM107003_16580 [Trichormus variabilis SAG 1403-4b]|uniref:Uncharacterized protein n=2 Tax=Nostocaceae TaxID=1162 RepID=A0A3S1C767_ANAVA|nr:hypothetical protein DSM107003_16580 [Trichormus variabilis SAG 1403-4b]
MLKTLDQNSAHFALTLNLKIVKDWKKTMDLQTIKERVASVQSKREYLLSLLEQPNLGTLRVDVNQALEELDDLIDEFRRSIPDTEIN